MLIPKKKICIVGAGAGGGVLAMELAKNNNFDITIIDVDCISNNFNNQSSFELKAKYTGSKLGFDKIKGYGFGGSTNLWHGVLTQLDEFDWERIDKAAKKNISTEVIESYALLEDYFPDASLFFSRIQNKNSKKGRLNFEFKNSSLFSYKNFLIQKKPFRVRPALNEIVRKHTNINVIENSIALYLESDGLESNEAKRIVISKNNTIEKISADYFVLSMGAFESPRLILQSIESGFNSLTNKNIGHYLSDHPWAIIGELSSKKSFFSLSMSDTKIAKGLSHRIGIRPKLVDISGAPNLNHCLALKPLFLDAQVKDVLKHLITMNLSLFNIVKVLFKFRTRDLMGTLAMLIAETTSRLVYVSRALVFCYLEQPENFESKVILTQRLDSWGRKIPEIKWELNSVDLNAAIQINSLLTKSFSQSNNFSYIPYTVNHSSFSSGLHHAGTLKIGSSKEDGVVDDNLKMFGSDNIFICDLSIFPFYGNSNPTYTLCAFSARLAKYFESKVNSEFTSV